jgi:hypothetical protein
MPSYALLHTNPIPNLRPLYLKDVTSSHTTYQNNLQPVRKKQPSDQATVPVLSQKLPLGRSFSFAFELR